MVTSDTLSSTLCMFYLRDYCTSGRHVVSMCANVIKVSVYLQVKSKISNYFLLLFLSAKLDVSLLEGEREYHGCGEDYNVNKGKGEAIANSL